MAEYEVNFFNEMRRFAVKLENKKIAAFLPAISSINMTHRLICYFYLHGNANVLHTKV